MKNHEPKAINASSTFVTHSCHELGNQALKILETFGVATKIVNGGDPAVTSDCVVFIKLVAGKSRGSFLRIHPTNPVTKDDLERQEFLKTKMPWTLRGRVIFINPLYAKCNGRFAGEPLQGFIMALSQLTRRKDESAMNQRKPWRQTRTERVRSGYFA